MATSEGLLINNLYWLFIPLASETLRFTHHDLPIEKQMQFLAKKLQSLLQERKEVTNRKDILKPESVENKNNIFCRIIFFSKNFAGGGKKN